MTTTSLRESVSGRRIGRRARLAGVIGIVAAVGTLVASVALAALNTSGGGSGSAGTGSVVVSLNSPPATVTCNVGPMSPGDSSTGWKGSPAGSQSDPGCVISVTYEGSLPAFIGVAASVSGSLYDATPNGLQYQITDGNGNAYTTNGVINENSLTSPLYVAPDAGGDNTVYTIAVNYALPKTYQGGSDSQDNAYQGQTATLTLTLEAVQSVDNGYPTTNGLATGPVCSPGSRCAGIGSW